jgi:hypothetical protein
MNKLGNNSKNLNKLRKTRDFPFADLTESLCRHYGDDHLRPHVDLVLDMLDASSYYEDYEEEEAGNGDDGASGSRGRSRK